MVDLSKEDSILEAIELLYLGYRSFTRGPDEVLGKRGLGRAHHRILYFIARNDGTSVGELLDILAISKQAMNTPLRQLIAMGMVKSKQSKTDARVKELRLTSDGKRLEARLTRSQYEQLQAIFARVGPEAHVGWRNVMHSLAALPSE